MFKTKKDVELSKEMTAQCFINPQSRDAMEMKVYVALDRSWSRKGEVAEVWTHFAAILKLRCRDAILDVYVKHRAISPKFFNFEVMT